MSRKSLVILAAGIGSRYGGLKQMDPIGPFGEFIIDYSIYDAIRAGFDKIVFLISRKIEADFKATIGARTEKHVAVEYAFQERNAVPPWFTAPAERSKPWGTGHALLSCRDHVHEPFAVINADDYYGQRSFRGMARFLDTTLANEQDYAMIGFVLKQTVSPHGHVARGLCQTDRDGRLKAVVERTRIECRSDGIGYVDAQGDWHPFSGRERVSMNFWGFKPSIFPYLEEQFETFLKNCGQDPKAEFFIPSVVNDLVGRGLSRVRVLETSEEWFGVTYPQDKPPVVRRIHELVQAGVYPARLWA